MNDEEKLADALKDALGVVRVRADLPHNARKHMAGRVPFADSFGFRVKSGRIETHTVERAREDRFPVVDYEWWPPA